MTSKAIIKAALADQEKAEVHFREVLNRGEGRANVLAVFADQPSAALARLNDTKALTDRGAADILDEVVGQVPDAERARELMEQELPPERLRQLLLARGDLVSTAAYIVSLEDIVQVVMLDMIEQMKDDEDTTHLTAREMSASEISIEEIDEAHGHYEDEGNQLGPSSSYDLEFNSPMPLFVILNWAHKIKDRADYPEFLDTHLGGYTAKQLIALALWSNAGCPTEVSDMPMGSFDEVGIDVDEAEELLTELLDFSPPRFSRGEIEDARMSLAKRRQAQATAPTLVDQARDAAEQVKDELDF